MSWTPSSANILMKRDGQLCQMLSQSNKIKAKGVYQIQQKGNLVKTSVGTKARQQQFSVGTTEVRTETTRSICATQENDRTEVCTVFNLKVNSRNTELLKGCTFLIQDGNNLTEVYKK